MALGKNRTLRAIDQFTGVTADSGATDVVVVEAAPTAPTPDVPTMTSVTASIDQSDRSATTLLAIAWEAPYSQAPSSYLIQIATDSAFTQNVEVFPVPAPLLAGDTPTATIRGRKPNFDYWVRVAAIFTLAQTNWSSALSVHTPSDSTPPSNATITSTSLQSNGDLVIVGTNPSESNFAQLEFIIRGSVSGPTYATLPLSGQPGAAFRFVWTAADNVRLSGGGDGTLSITVVSRNWSGYGSSGTVVAASKSTPNAPTITASWDSLTGTLGFYGSYDAFCTLSLTLDGVARVVTLPYAYDVTTNKNEHSGTADPAITWSAVATDPLNQASTATSGTATLARPATPTGATATWDAVTGTNTFAWTAVSGIPGYQLTIDGITRTVNDVRYAYVVGQNRQEHAGTADPSLTWSLVAVDGLGQTSTTPASGTSTLAAPATPTVSTTDFTTDTAIWRWSAVTGAALYRLTIDGVARDLTTTNYDFPFALNAQEHSGGTTAAQLLDMASLTWSLVSVDGLGQTSTVAASGTLTNAVPSAATSISVIGGATGLFIAISPAPPADFRDYTVRIIKDGTTYETLTRTVGAFAYVGTANGSYTVGVIINDVFGQSSTEFVTSSGVTVDVLSMSELRADCVYSDSVSTSSSTLAGLKDDDRATNVVTYAAGTSWKWTEAKRSTSTRVGNIAITATAGTGYVGISEDGTTYTWFSGPLQSDGQTLTAVASEAAAQTAALSLPTTTTGVWSLPTTQSARYVRLGHRNTSASYSLREFYPPTLIVVDNLRAGMIRGMTVVANQLVANTLAALSASLGAVDISGICTIGSAGGIYQGSAGTFGSPTTGLKIYQSATGKGLLETWLAGVKQIYFDDTDMGLGFGGGRGKLSASGLRLFASTSTSVSSPSADVAWYQDGITSRWYGLISTHPSNAGMAILTSPRTATDYSRMLLGATTSTSDSFNPRSRITVQGNISDPFDDNNYVAVSAFSSDAGGQGITVYPYGVLINTPTQPSSYAGKATRGAFEVLGGTAYLPSLAIGAIYGGGGAGGTKETNPALTTDGTNTTIGATSGSGQVRFVTGTGQRAYIDSSGNVVAVGAYYPGNQTSLGLAYSAAGVGGGPGLFTNGAFQAASMPFVNVGTATGAATGDIKTSGSVSVASGLNVGTATGASVGQIFSSGRARINGATDVSTVGMLVRGLGATGATASLRCESNTGLGRFTIYDNGDGEITANFSVGNSLSIANELRISGGTGFYGATPIAKPTVTGSRGGNAALASLLTALASMGQITNSTTA